MRTQKAGECIEGDGAGRDRGGGLDGHGVGLGRGRHADRPVAGGHRGRQVPGVVLPQHRAARRRRDADHGARHRHAQSDAIAAVSISYLVELGNGDKFLFDMGLGSMVNLFSLRPDFSKLDKVFVSHLHIDHVGDFMGCTSAVGCPAATRRSTSTARPAPDAGAGHQSVRRGMQKGYAWDLQTRTGRLPDKGAQDRGARVRLQAGERGRLRGERRHHPLLAGDPQPGRLGQLQPRVERPEVRVRRGYLPQQVVHRVRQVDADVASHEAFLPPKELCRSTSAGA